MAGPEEALNQQVGGKDEVPDNPYYLVNMNSIAELTLETQNEIRKLLSSEGRQEAADHFTSIVVDKHLQRIEGIESATQPLHKIGRAMQEAIIELSIVMGQDTATRLVRRKVEDVILDFAR